MAPGVFFPCRIKFVHEFKDYSGGTTSNGKLDPDSFQPYYMYTLHTIDASHKVQPCVCVCVLVVCVCGGGGGGESVFLNTMFVGASTW